MLADSLYRPDRGAGVTVILPRKHMGTIYELTALEQEALWQLVSEVRLVTGLTLDGFSIGRNDVMHEGVTTPCLSRNR